MKSMFYPLFPLLLLAGCSLTSISLVPLDGSQTNDLSRVSVIEEDQRHPLLLRGLDGVPIKSMMVPSALWEYAYVMSAGSHVLWAKSGALYPYPLIPQRLRCYLLHAELAQGGRYSLREDVEAKKALLLITTTGEVVAKGEVVDEPWVFMDDCTWNQPR